MVVLGWFLITAEVAAPALYRNGVLVIVSIAAAAAVARSSAVQDGDRTLFGRTVVAGVPRYLGLRSYAIYLWSWPIQVLLSFRFPELAKPWVAAITVAASLALSEISYRVVECPIRYRTGWAAQDRTRRPAWSAAVLGAAAILVAALVLAVPPAAHERVDTAAAAADAMHEAAPAPPSLGGSEGGSDLGDADGRLGRLDHRLLPARRGQAPAGHRLDRPARHHRLRDHERGGLGLPAERQRRPVHQARCRALPRPVEGGGRSACPPTPMSSCCSRGRGSGRRCRRPAVA